MVYKGSNNLEFSKKMENDSPTENTECEAETVETPTIESKEREYIERLARLQAEFENFRRRAEKEKVENSLHANSNLIFQLLNILDHFELSMKHNKDEGVVLIYEELSNILKNHG